MSIYPFRINGRCVMSAWSISFLFLWFLTTWLMQFQNSHRFERHNFRIKFLLYSDTKCFTFFLFWPAEKYNGTKVEKLSENFYFFNLRKVFNEYLLWLQKCHRKTSVKTNVMYFVFIGIKMETRCIEEKNIASFVFILRQMAYLYFETVNIPRLAFENKKHFLKKETAYCKVIEWWDTTLEMAKVWTDIVKQ